MVIRLLVPDDAPAFQELRLSALQESPTSFVATYEEEQDLPLETVATRLAATRDTCVVGAFDDGRLVGIAGMRREDRRKLAHKAMLWGVYVSPEFRNRGVARQLVAHALAYAAGMPGISKVYLGVNAANPHAMALYESFGFEPYGQENGFMLVDGVPQDEVFMLRAVRPSDR